MNGEVKRRRNVKPSPNRRKGTDPCFSAQEEKENKEGKRKKKESEKERRVFLLPFIIITFFVFL